jgi:hypothetical protein
MLLIWFTEVKHDNVNNNINKGDVFALFLLKRSFPSPNIYNFQVAKVERVEFS